MNEGEAKRAALQSIKKFAKGVIADQYKAKKAKPAEVKTKTVVADDHDLDQVDEDEPVESEDEDLSERTEIQTVKRKPNKPEIPSGGFAPPAKKRGRPPKQK